MNEIADALTLVGSRWAKTLIHVDLLEVDGRKRLYTHTCWQPMSETIDTLTRVGSRWAKSPIHSHCLQDDERKRWYTHTFWKPMRETADTLALFGSRRAKPLIHSHLLEADERKRWYTNTFEADPWTPAASPRKQILIKMPQKHCMFDLGKGAPFQGGFPVITDRVIKSVGLLKNKYHFFKPSVSHPGLCKPMSENADTLTCFESRLAKKLIHSHFLEADERNR